MAKVFPSAFVDCCKEIYVDFNWPSFSESDSVDCFCSSSFMAYFEAVILFSFMIFSAASPSAYSLIFREVCISLGRELTVSSVTFLMMETLSC